jgi:hypothetical protein
MSEPWSTFGFTGEQRMMRESVLDLLAGVLPSRKIRELGGGSNEVQRNIIAKLLGL